MVRKISRMNNDGGLIMETVRIKERSDVDLSPFEFKDRLIEMATEQEKKSAHAMLNAGRGNPNWVAVSPREAFFLLGEFAAQESRRAWNQGDLAGMPERTGCANRIDRFLRTKGGEPGSEWLRKTIDYGVKELRFEADAWVYELVDGIIGDNYPTPDRMLTHAERVVREFLVREVYGMRDADGNIDLFAVEGATAGMCYVFDSLLENHLLQRGDRVAVMTPIFPPYFEIPQLYQYEFDVVEIRATGNDDRGGHTWQYPSSELQKLGDTSIRVLFVVNPSNPPSVAMLPTVIDDLVTIVKTQNPRLMIISDDVYATFVDDFHSIMAALPYNTLGVYSFSKYFGVTGWRLGVVALAANNVFDKRLRELAEGAKTELRHRYSSLTSDSDSLCYMDRLVADSRQVALRHTAGLSTPQQVQMTLLAAFDLLDDTHRYRDLTKAVCQRRMTLLYDGLGLPHPHLPNDADYYTEFDLLEWSTMHYGQAFASYLQTRHEPVDILYRLAQNASIVLLNGGGFHGPKWSVRVSLANLRDEDYATIGRELHRALEAYVAEWKNT